MHDDETDDDSARPEPTLSAETLQRAAALFRAAGDPARLALLSLIGAGERCVSELAELTGEQMSTISQRLKLLRSAQLVRRRREGKHIYYRLADAHVAALIHSALEHAAEADPAR
jgi:ArsR family transcriptional regulator, lead/cadmium/zinc/bismuth-responsive transcriptional repressor